MFKELDNCRICPNKCNVNRNIGEIGRCKSNSNIKIALYSIHNFEEPCISGNNGSGTIFFSNCNLNCVFCQNYEISQKGRGKEITVEELVNIFLEQQKLGVENINLVTQTSYVIQIIDAIKKAKERGLKIPIVYNTNAYENIDTIKMLDGYIDVYLPDLKYSSDELAKKYSKVDNYFEIATEVIKEMQRQTGKAKLNDRGIMEKGLIVRHLVLPNAIENSKNVFKWLKNNLYEENYISVMAQYFPTYLVKENIEYKDINRKLTKKEWKEIEDFIDELDFKNGFIQELGEHEEEYVPKWW